MGLFRNKQKTPEDPVPPSSTGTSVLPDNPAAPAQPAPYDGKQPHVEQTPEEEARLERRKKRSKIGDAFAWGIASLGAALSAVSC